MKKLSLINKYAESAVGNPTVIAVLVFGPSNAERNPLLYGVQRLYEAGARHQTKRLLLQKQRAATATCTLDRNETKRNT